MNILNFICVNKKLPLHIKESDMLELEKDLQDDKKLKLFLNERPAAAINKTNIKKGFNAEYRFDSFAEFTFYYFERYYKGYTVVKNTSENLPYTDENGKKRNFIPDFMVNSIWHEVKGRVSKTDEKKRDAYPDIIWVYQSQINDMAAELDSIYGQKWRDGFVQTN